MRIHAIVNKEKMSFSKCLILVLLAFQVLYSESVAVESVAVPRSLPDTIRKHSVLGRKNNLKRNSVIVAENNGNDLIKFGNANGESEVSLNAFDLCLCGAFATAFGDFVMHPVDTIKVSQQVCIYVYICMIISLYTRVHIYDYMCTCTSLYISIIHTYEYM
jgi:hypothetical protein